jgi:pilus assembly protein CpaF
LTTSTESETLRLQYYADLIARRPGLLDEKLKLHGRIIDEFNLAALEKLPPEEVARQVRSYVLAHAISENLSLNQNELDIFAEEILAELTGYGPIEPLLKDPTVTDILINTHKRCYVERFGRLQETKVHFKDEAHLLRIVNKIVAAIGRRVDESSPMVDARLPDGSRVNVAVRPIAVDGPLVSIRKFAERPFTMDALVSIGTLRQPMADVLAAAVAGRVSTVITGGTGSGKTTLLNAMSSHIPNHERLITIEDAAELQLQQPHIARLETRPANVEGKGEIRQRDLVKNALRMRPDRIIIGECRAEEAFDMLQAMNTGHEGSMTTIHANSPRDALKRLEQMVGMAGMTMTQSAVRSQIASALTLVVQVQRLVDGARRVVSISEITGMESEIIQMHEIFRFVKESTDAEGKLHGTFRATGIRPNFLADLRAYGIEIPVNHFDPSRVL